MMKTITYAAISKPGNRAVNEDSISVLEKDGRYIFVLADGLGGHGRGEAASKLAVDASVKIFSDGNENLGVCIGSAQDRLMSEQIKQNAQNEMKTTIVCLKFTDGKAQWGFVGDSRVYHFRRGKLVTRSLDHSVPQMLVASGEIKERDIRHHEDRNRLIRVLGIEWNSERYELSEETEAIGGDAFLLCSDGFWEWIVEKEMQRNLRAAGTPQRWLELMEAEVLKNGKNRNMDNYSAIAVYVGNSK
jgi:serine/threonine protein phosphatase PrpC